MLISRFRFGLFLCRDDILISVKTPARGLGGNFQNTEKLFAPHMSTAGAGAIEIPRG